MTPRLAILTLLIFGLTGSVKAYEVETHSDLSATAALQSILGTPTGLSRLGWRPIGGADLYPNSTGIPHSAIQLIRDGATFEDDFPRSIHHFFNPRNGGALSMNLGDFSFPTIADEIVASHLIADVNALAQSSPDWVLAATLFAAAENSFSFRNARDYFFQGIINQSTTLRSQNIGLMFESLGRMIHHMQDMAQPQHVRNDEHLHILSWEAACDRKLPAACGLYRSISRPSAYEHWTNRDDVRSNLPLTGYAPVYASFGQGADGLSVFLNARSFWANGEKGLADFTSRNFLSAGTMQVSPPSLGKPFQMQVTALCTGAVPPCEATFDSDDVITFFPSTVDDKFRPASVPNPYAAGASIFDPEFVTRTGNPIRTVNRFTFANDYFFLLPRAIGYSAGLINYFFRGDMEIGLPEESIYAVVDQGSNSCGNPCGFRKLKLKLKNITAGNEVMGAGTLRAVVKYHSNTCYRSDLAGEYGGDPTVFKGNACRSPEEYVAVSQPVPITDGEVRSDQAKLFTFLFDDLNPVPIRTSDAYLQVVFRGKLGQEDDAVAVTTKNIVEPNYVAVANMTDYAYDDTGDNKYHAIPYKTVFGDLSVANFGIAFGSNTTPVATMVGLRGGQHAQIAFLTDVAELPTTISFSGYQDQSWVLEPEEFALDDTTGQFVRSCPVFLARGVYRQYLYWFYNPVSAHGLGFRQISSQRGEMPAAGAGGDKLRKHSSINYDCKIPTGGVYDFSTMTPLSPNTALPWAINF